MLDLVPCEAQSPSADLVLRHGKIATLDPNRPTATALAVRGERIVAVGDDASVEGHVGPATRVIDLEGKRAIPGFIEGHAHFLGLGEAKMVLDLSQAKSWDEIVGMVEQAARRTPPGHWIEGRGWHQAKWRSKPQPNVQGYPTHEKLSAATPTHPVLLTHGTGHMVLANAKAMELARVDRTTRDPAGGEILRDARGAPAGLFREAAAEIIGAATARTQTERSAAEIAQRRDEAIRRATEECLSLGITSFQDAGASLAEIDHFRQLAQRGQLGVRLWVMVQAPNRVLAEKLAQYRMIGVGHHRLTVRAIKVFIDGALGTHGAWLLEPYADFPGSSGLNTTSPEEIAETARLALSHDFQLCVHAIGDRANRQTLDLFADALGREPSNDVRWRIEHAQHLDPADIPRFARLGVIAAMQGCHATSDAPFVIQRLGERRAREGAYAWRSLLSAGALIVNGSDAPVEPVDPIASFYASVTRKLPDRSAFFPEQRMTRDEALRSYTLDAAYAAFEEKLKGSLVPGKLADIAILSHDLLTVPEEKILETRVVMTIVGGCVVYTR